MLDNSGENIKWLEDNGVLFSGVVDTYGTLGKVPCFHWFVDGSGANLTDPLEAKALSYGVEIRYNTRGNQLIMENDAVAGIYAEKEDGSTLQVNCNGVILASGGYVGNIEKMASLGIPEDEVYLLGPGRVGDGLNMAVEAGGVDRSAKSCFLREASFMHSGWLAPVQSWVIYDGTVIWVNEYGERYADETCGEETSGCITNAYYTQSEAFAVWGQNAVDAASEDVQSKLAEEIANGNEYVKKYENLSNLCSDWGIDQAGLEETINNYNGYCEISSDEEFDKDPTKLITIEAPYYAGDFSAMNMQAIGAIETNRSFQVIRPDKTPVSGLYAVGTDGCMLYGETYTIKVPGSCNANNINSGRTAAKHAVANL